MRDATCVLLTALLASTACAQAKKPDPKKEPAKKPDAAEKAPERPKDDATTAKDAAIVAIDKFIKDKGPSKKRADWRTASSLPPKLPLEKSHEYFWHLKTNKGEITVKLFADTAPQHASSTIYLARLGFYDGLTFHRVIKGFMAQGGCPAGDGSGSPGYSYDGELDNARRHDHEGMVSMANGGPKTDGSQFFVTFAKAPHLDGKHTILGEVTAGMDAVKALEAAANPEDENKPSERLAIETSWIVVTAGAEPPPKPKPDEKKK